MLVNVPAIHKDVLASFVGEVPLPIIIIMQISLSPIIKYRTSIFLVLIAAGLAGNYFSFPIFLNIDFLFGSIFALLILQFFGLSRGILSAAVIASCTFFLWNHPFAIFIMTAEVGAVGWQMEHNKRGLVLADTLYWLIIGIPLVYIFYHLTMHVSLSNTCIVIAKQAVNGIANALVARLGFIGFNLRSRASLISSSEIIGNLLSFFVLCPTLLILAIGSRSDFTEADSRIRTLLIQDSQLMNEYLKNWVVNRESVITNLAEMAASRSPQQMQSYLELAKRSNANFLRIGLLDREATTTAYFPLVDELGQENIGKNFADRPFVPTLKQRLKPMLSEVVMGRIGPPKPMVAMLAPVVIHEEYAGYVTGIMSLDQIRGHLDKRMNDNAMLYTLVDKNGNIIMTNRTDQKVMTPFFRDNGTINHLDKGIDQWVPVMPSNVSIMERWKNSFYVAETVVGQLAEWKLIMEQPVAPFQKALYDKYTSKLIFLFLILLGALALAEVFSRWFIADLVKLSMISRDLPARLESRDQEIAWPVSGIDELGRLINVFREMSTSLALRFDNVQKINESLELHVKERTAELLESRELYKSILNASPDDITITDMEGRILMVSPSGIAAFGGESEGDFLGQLITNFIVPEDRERALSNFILKARGLLSDLTEYRGLRKNGTISNIEVKSDFLFESDGQPSKAVLIIRDITDRKLAENKLKESEAKYSAAYALMRLLCDNVPDMIWAKDLDGRYIFTNEAICRDLLNAVDTLEPIGKNDLFFADRERKGHPDNLNWHTFGEVCGDTDLRTIEAGMPQQFDEYGNVQGRFLFLDVRKAPLFDEKGKMIGTVGTARDVTIAKALEKKLKESEARLNAAAKAANFGIYWYDFTNGDSYYSPEFFELYGLPSDAHLELDEDFVPKALHPEDRQDFLEKMQAANSPCGSGVFEHRYRIIRHDGQIRWLKVIGQTVFSGNTTEDRPMFANGIIHDISDRKFAEEAMRAALQEKEILLREIHHRVKNNMQMISSLLSLQTERVKNEQVRQALAESQQRIIAMAMIHETLYRGKDLAYIDLSDYLKRLVSHLQGVYNSQATVDIILELEKVELSSDLVVPCGLIINELLTNAFKHAFPGGRKGTIQIKNYLVNERELVLEVSDNGVGLPTDLDFENTSSLGLKLVKGLLKHQLKGNWDVTVGKGTTFILHWPLPA
jgi:PAS domain S-box-containing protein